LTAGVSPNSLAKVILTNVLAGTINAGGGTYSNTVAATSCVNNNGAGLVNFTANSTIGASVSNANAASLIHLGANTVTLSGAATTVTNTGKIISDAAGVIGSGTLGITGTTTVTGGELPNVTVSGSGTLTLGGTVVLYGSYTQTSAAAGALAFGANTMNVKGNWSRTSNSPGDVTSGVGGTLQFSAATGSQTFLPGASLSLYNLTVNKVSGSVEMGASVIITNNVTITSGSLDLGDYNVRMTATGTFDNSGSFYSTTNNGFVIFEGAGGTITGTGTFGNLDIRVGSGNTVTATSAIGFSGILYLRSGKLQMGGNFLTLTSALVARPSIYRDITSTATTATLDKTGPANNPCVAVGPGVTYDLYYFDANVAAQAITASYEWLGAGIFNLSVISTGAAHTVTIPPAALVASTTIQGALTIASGQTLILYNTATQTLTATGSVTHTILGSLNGGTFSMQGATVVLNGSTVAADAATIGTSTAVGSFNFEPPNASSGGTLTVSNLKTVTGDVTIQGTSIGTSASASITFNSVTSVIGGNYFQGNATVGPTVSLIMNGSTTSTHTGNLTVTSGSLTYTRGATTANRTVGGFVSLLNAGALTLGSTVFITGTTTMGGTSTMALGTFNYNAVGAFTRSGTGALSASTGKLVLAHTGSVLFTPGVSFTVPNLEVKCAGFTTTLTGNGVTVSTAFTFTSGTFDYNALTLTVSGNMTYTAGAFAATGGGGLSFTGAASTVTLAGDLATIGTLTVNSTGTVTVVSDDEVTPSAARTLTSTGNFTLTAGTLAMGRHHLIILAGGTTGFVRVAGGITQGTGYLKFNNAALDFATGTGFAIDNLEIMLSATNATDNKSYTVNKNLLLTAGTLTQGATGKLLLLDGATITRNAGIFAAAPTFPASPGTINLVYKFAGAQATSFEYPTTATVVKDLTIDNGAIGNVVSLPAASSRTVNGTLYLKVGTLNVSTSTLTLATGGRYKITSTGALDVLTGPGTFSFTTYHLEYTGGGSFSTTSTEFPTSSTAILSLTISTTGGAVVTLNSSKTLNTDLIINSTGAGAGLKLGTTIAWYTLTVKGNVTLTAGGFISNGARTAAGTARPTLAFGGTAAQTLTVPAAGYTFFSGVDATIAGDGDVDDIGDTPAFDVSVNNTAAADADKYVATAGGNVTMGSFGVVRFTSGVIYTGSAANPYSYTWTLMQGTLNNQPTQGFDRSGVATTGFGHFVGNVKKFVDAFTAGPAISVMQFPVGSAPASKGNYRPFSIFFSNGAPPASINLTVSHTNSSAGGSNGFPIAATPYAATNYPGFFWYVKSDIQISPSFRYDAEAQAEGYTDYGYANVEDIRFVRRDSGQVSNNWIVQASASGAGYDNSTIAGTIPVVKVIAATGGLTTQGSIFTYSQSNKAPYFTSAMVNSTVLENAALTGTFTAADLDLNQTVTLSAVTKPAGSTFTAGAFSWTPSFDAAPGPYTLTIRATDNSTGSDPATVSKDTTITITVTNVNRAPSFTGTGTAALTNSTIKDGQALAFTYIAVDADGGALAYSLAVTPVTTPAPTISATTGAMSWTPGFAQAGTVYTFTATATDAGALIGTTTATVTVNRSVGRGDANLNGSVTAADAAVDLQYTVGLYTAPTGEDGLRFNYAADASGNGTITAFDAAKILLYVADPIANPLSNIVSSTGTQLDASLSKSAVASMNWGRLRSGDEADVLQLPLVLGSGSSNVYSIEISMQIPAGIELKAVSTNLPEGWIMEKYIDQGELHVALAGSTPMSGREFGALSFRILDKSVRFAPTASGRVNENLSMTMTATTISAVPVQFGLDQNYPNPFNPSTKITYQLPVNAKVVLDIYNIVGQKVRTLVNAEQEPGYYSIDWNGLDDASQRLASGVYMYRIQAGSFVQINKMLMLK
jgi:hypothetical protein